MRSITTDHRILPRLLDKEEYLYVEHAVVEQDNYSICIIQGNKKTPIPICSVACIILGSGTSITHRAIQSIAESRCLLVWGGEKLRSYYVTGFERNRLSRNVLTQIKYYSDKTLHLETVCKMYQKRFPDIKTNDLSLEQLRGMEGLRMKEIYSQFANEYNVNWNGRKYDHNNFEDQDDVNKFITIGNQLLYNICRAAIYTLGYSPAIGFIHTGHMDSFIYDIADLYKTNVVIPVAFENTAIGSTDFSKIRKDCHEKMKEISILNQIESDLTLFFKESDALIETSCGLWDQNDVVPMGGNHSHIL